jgi:flavin-dependent dehydrogenase
MIDVLIAGGGPAGLATALHATARGLHAVVVEPRLPPVDKACGEGLMPPAVAALGRLGVDPPGLPFYGIRYVDGTRAVVGRFAGEPGLGVRRTRLHEALAGAVAAAGIEVATGRVGEVAQDDRGVRAAGLRARWLVAADGLHSSVRRAVGLAEPVRRPGRRVGSGPPRRTRFGLRQHFAVSPWTDLVEVHWAAGAEAYVTPVAPNCVGIAFLTSEPDGYQQWLARFPVLRDRLDAAPARSEVRGAGPLRQRVTGRVAGRVLLVGDAAGYVDALTGEGIGLALAQADAAAGCLAAGRPGRYEQAWRRITREHRIMTGALLWCAGRPELRPLLVPAAAALPGVFGYAVNRLARPPGAGRRRARTHWSPETDPGTADRRPAR